MPPLKKVIKKQVKKNRTKEIVKWVRQLSHRILTKIHRELKIDSLIGSNSLYKIEIFYRSRATSKWITKTPRAWSRTPPTITSIWPARRALDNIRIRLKSWPLWLPWPSAKAQIIHLSKWFKEFMESIRIMKFKNRKLLGTPRIKGDFIQKWYHLPVEA